MHNKFKVIVILLFVSSFSLLLSFFGDYKGNIFNLIMAYAVPVLFWGCMIAAYIMLIFFNKKRKEKNNEVQSRGSKRYLKENSKSLPGLFKFFSNKYAFAADIFMVFFLILTIVFLFVPLFNQGLAIICLAIFVFCLHMHCLLNGTNFTYILFNEEE